MKRLKAACERNNRRASDIQMCMGGLYHGVSKSFHCGDGSSNVIIDGRIWADAEVFALGAILEEFHIAYLYYNQFGDLSNFPFNLSEWWNS